MKLATALGGWTAAVALLLTVAGCGSRPECDRYASCKAPPRLQTETACAIRAFESPTTEPTYPLAAVTYATAPAVEVGTATPEPSPSPVPPSTETPTVTPTLIPPPPDQPRYVPPTSDFTPRARPTYPAAGDIEMDSDGCYRARVDGCTWNETRRFNDASSRLVVQLKSRCAYDIVLVFHPDNGEVTLLSVLTQ